MFRNDPDWGKICTFLTLTILEPSSGLGGVITPCYIWLVAWKQATVKKRILTAHLAIFPAGTYEDFYRLNKCMENLIIFTY